MKFGVREICDVVFKASSKYQKVGNQVFLKGQPILYFDSLKISTLEQASSTVYAQGGRGNSRLISWDGDKVVTFSIEDALMSPKAIAILAQSHLLENISDEVLVHKKQRKQCLSAGALVLEQVPSDSLDIWVGLVTSAEDDEIIMEKFQVFEDGSQTISENILVGDFVKDSTYEIDYYYVSKRPTNIITIEPESFGGNFYVEASTLFRDKSGQDIPARFVIPNCRPQSNFSFTLSSTGDPSTFTFVLDVFPGYTNYNQGSKVLAEIQIIDEIDLLSEEDYLKLQQYGSFNVTPSPADWFIVENGVITGLNDLFEDDIREAIEIVVPFEIYGEQITAINSRLDSGYIDLSNLVELRIPKRITVLGKEGQPLITEATKLKRVYVWSTTSIQSKVFNSINMPLVVIVTLEEIYSDWDDLY